MLGPTGMGVIGLLNTSISLVGKLTSLGLSNSAIRDISQAKESKDEIKISKTIQSFRRWVYFTGLSGTAICLLVAPFLSELAFGNEEYTWAFYWLSFTLFINAISSGQTSLIRGMRMIRMLAKCSVLGALTGLFVSIPLYYYYGVDGIVPSFIISSIATLLTSWYFSSKIKISKIDLTFKESYFLGLDMAKLGVMISLSGLLTSGATFVLHAFISRTGGIEELGLYTAGWSLVGQYVGIVFGAMSTDYYPRLAGVKDDNDKMSSIVNHQIEIAILILGPLLILLLGLMPLLIRLFLSSSFLGVVDFANWLVIGILFKVSSWAMGYILLAKANTKLFFISELVSHLFLLGSNILGYYFLGLEGLGMSFILNYIFHICFIYWIVNKHYRFKLGKEYFELFIISFCLVVSTFLTCKFLNSGFVYLISFILLMVSLVYTFHGLDKRLLLRTLIIEKWNQRKK